MSLFWILLGLSIPVFYIYGLGQFITNLSSSSKKTQSPQLLKQLREILNTNPNISLKQALKLLKFDQTDHSSFKLSSKKPATETIAYPPPIKKQSANITSNWYSQNSINLLLYLGAFLIIAATSIFLSFQWETLTPTNKALLVNFFTIAWFVFGYWFYQLPKVKSAGLTFLGIGSILIPVSALAWQMFVFQENTTQIGIIWFLASTTSITINLIIARLTRNQYFTYLFNLSWISLALSFVRLSHLDHQFYVLATLAAVNLSLLLFHSLKKIVPHLSTTTPAINNIVVPISLILGYYQSPSDLLTLEASIAILLSITYFGLMYLNTKKQPYLFIGSLLTFAFTYILLRSHHVETKMTLYPLFIQSFAFLALGIWQYYQQHAQKFQVFLSISLATSLLWYLFSLTLFNNHPQFLLFITAPIVISFTTAFYLGQTRLRYLFIGLLYTASFHIFKITAAPDHYLPLVFAIDSIIIYHFHLLAQGSQAKTIYRLGALAGALSTTLITYTSSQLRLAHGTDFEIFSLSAAYLGVGLYTLESLHQKSRSLTYLTAGLALATFLWQINLLNFTQAQFYTLPLAVYFLTISHLERHRNKADNVALLDLIGVTFLLLPTIGQSFGRDGTFYSVLLGIYSVSLVFFGNTLEHKSYRTAGIIGLIIAIYSQTSDFIYSLPRWLIVGIVGLIFISIALYLLQTRNDHHSKPPKS